MLFSTIELLIQKRNTILDNVFYDTNSLTPEERERLILEKNTAGSIIIVFPKNDNIAHKSFQTVQDFAQSTYKTTSRFVIAGVGSSDLGSAALARNVADFFDEPVGAIVAGYGINDFISEVLGSWFSLGMGIEKTVKPTKEKNAEKQSTLLSTGSPDTTTILNLLLNEDLDIKLVLGHSKGCLSLSNALFSLTKQGCQQAIDKYADRIQIITTGSVIDIPKEFKLTSQFLGGYDWFGRLNSQFGLTFNKIAGAWHHTNTSLPLSMNIANLLTSESKRPEESIESLST